MSNLNEKYVELIGYPLGDGHVHLTCNYTGWGNSNLELIKSFRLLSNEIKIGFKTDFRPARINKPINNLPIFSRPSIRLRFKLPEELMKFTLRG